MGIRILISLTALLALSACQSNEKEKMDALIKASMTDSTQANDKPSALQQVPDAVNQALLPNSSGNLMPLMGERKYDINARDVAATQFFAGLVKDSPYSVAIHPMVSGKISLDLKQVSLDEIFDLVSEIYGYEIQKRGNIYKVYPPGIRTETFSVNYLLMKRNGQTQTSIQSGGVSQTASYNNGNSSNSNVLNNYTGNSSTGNNYSNNSSSNGTNIYTNTDTDFWQGLKDTLTTLIGNQDGRSVIVLPQAGMVTVKAMPDELRVVKKFLQISEQTIQRQVILEARIIEVSLDDSYQQGINWSEISASGADNTKFSFNTSAGSLGNQISASIGGITSLSILNADFSGVVSLLSTQGDVQVLSSPRVTATNNQKAVIKVGDDEYFVTDVSSQTTTSSSTTSVVPNIELTPFFSGIALDVTPQIDENGGVLLHVHPSVIETEEQEKTVTLNEEEYVLPLAQSNIRESDTVIHARSGEIVVIGGLMQTSKSNYHSKTPLLGSIPLLGELFKSRQEQEVKKELIILLKPTVVGPDTWRQQLQQSREYMADWLYVE